MSFKNLSSYFDGVSTKALTLVDTKGSNQHEVGGPKKDWNRFRQILGDVPRRIKHGNGIPTRYIYINSEQETIQAEGECSWYDTRAQDEKRSAEWRVYYQSNDVTGIMDPGDQLFLAKTKDDYLLFIVVAEASELVDQLRYLFGFDRQGAPVSIKNYSDSDIEFDFLTRFILDEIGVELENPEANTIDTIIDRFGMSFPGTKEFSQLARQTLPAVSALDDPDIAIVAWLDHEEAMFRRLESRIVSERISQGWVNEDGVVDVDGFIKYSTRVRNRRMSRMGHALENHLAAVFDEYGLIYEPQKRTEKGKKPDFIFPGIKEYFDPQYSVDLLTMLAAKSTCKDRWSQVLSEAERLDTKHLMTLELSLSESQTDTMRASDVQLIAPDRIRESYNDSQREWVWCLSDFVSLVYDRQARASL